MSSYTSLGFGSRRRALRADAGAGLVMLKRPLQRLMAFRGMTIDDIVNNPIAKNEAFGYWKVFRQIERHAEIRELERQWNRLGQRL